MKNRGFTLLLAVLITSIILGISFGLSVFITRELNISTLGRESQKAVFAADTGMECVFYWEFAHGGLPQSAFATNTPGCSAYTISCAGGNYSVGGSCAAGGMSSFTLNLNSGSCVLVEVDKLTVYPSTIVKARGRSTCTPGSLNRVERAFQVVY